MKCEYCENEVPNGANWCPSCGARITGSRVVVESYSESNSQNSCQQHKVPPSRYYEADRKSRLAYIVIAFFLGEIGVHNFYAGYYGRGVAQFLITTLSFGLLFWVSWIWAVVEMVTVEKDSKGVPFN